MVAQKVIPTSFLRLLKDMHIRTIVVSGYSSEFAMFSHVTEFGRQPNLYWFIAVNKVWLPQKLE
jgi:hypothetical protein